MTASSRDPFRPRGAIRAMIYRVLWMVIAALEKTANGCLYVAVGLLHRGELRDISRMRSTAFSAPDEHMEAGLEPWEDRVYSSVLREADHVLVVGCGGGRELLALGARGYRVTGVDQVPDLIEAARRNLSRQGLTAALIAAPIETAELSDTYDVVLFSACVYGYMAGSQSRVATLRRLKTHLGPGGRLVATYVDTPPGSWLRPWLARTAGWLTRSDWRAEPEDTFARGPLHLPFYERRMSASAVRDELASAGFRIVRDEAISLGRCAIAEVHS